jgi:prepilin-type N-terminal cleavage/methylation domain-containing protein/prepilin-type processing-associated H-X9-DG protein
MTTFTSLVAASVWRSAYGGSRWTGKRGFSLLELIVVVAIIAILLAILLPIVASARRQSVTAVCASNLRSLAIAMNAYASENRGCMPIAEWIYDSSVGEVGPPWGRQQWAELIAPYLDGRAGTWAFTGPGQRATYWGCPKWRADSDLNPVELPLKFGYGINMVPSAGNPVSTAPNGIQPYRVAYPKWFTAVNERSTSQGPSEQDRGRFFRLSEFKPAASRALIVDATDWKAWTFYPPNDQRGYADLDVYRHAGLGRSDTPSCNVLYADGHAMTVTPKVAALSLVNPAAATN